MPMMTELHSDADAALVRGVFDGMTPISGGLIPIEPAAGVTVEQGAAGAGAFA